VRVFVGTAAETKFATLHEAHAAVHVTNTRMARATQEDFPHDCVLFMHHTAPEHDDHDSGLADKAAIIVASRQGCLKPRRVAIHLLARVSQPCHLHRSVTPTTRSSILSAVARPSR
jgi:hypothetical protein